MFIHLIYCCKSLQAVQLVHWVISVLPSYYRENKLDQEVIRLSPPSFLPISICTCFFFPTYSFPELFLSINFSRSGMKQAELCLYNGKQVVLLTTTKSGTQQINEFFSSPPLPLNPLFTQHLLLISICIDMQQPMRHERDVLKALRHPTVLQFIGQCDDGFSFVTEFCANGDVFAYLSQV